MPQAHEHHEQGSGERSWNVFVRFQKGFERRFNQFRESYGALLERVIARRRAFVTISLAIAVGAMSLFFFLGRDYFPEIRSGVIQMHMRAPLGTRLVGIVEDVIEPHREAVEGDRGAAPAAAGQTERELHGRKGDGVELDRRHVA